MNAWLNSTPHNDGQSQRDTHEIRPHRGPAQVSAVQWWYESRADIGEMVFISVGGTPWNQFFSRSWLGMRRWMVIRYDDHQQGLIAMRCQFLSISNRCQSSSKPISIQDHINAFSRLRVNVDCWA